VAIALDGARNLFIADSATTLRVTAAGIISTVAGSGCRKVSAETAASTSAALDDPTGVAVDKDGTLFIGRHNTSHRRRHHQHDRRNRWVRFHWRRGPAAVAGLVSRRVAMDRPGNLYIAEATAFARSLR